jgi:predicted nucleic acid-binding protein
MVILDSSVFIDQFRADGHRERIDSIDEPIRTSAVVLAELWRGASAQAEKALLGALERRYPVLAPTEKNWLESGQILARMHNDYGFEPRKLRELHFDVLIALTARTHGVRLITSNRADFELIREYRAFKLEVW